MRFMHSLLRLRRSGLLLLPLLAILLPGPSHSFGQGAEPLTITQVIVAEDGKSVRAVLSLIDANGEPIQDATDFETQIDGKATDHSGVLPVVDAATGLSVLLLLDVSGSMEGDALAQAKAAASSFVNGMLPSDSAGIASFANSVVPVTPLTSDRNALLAGIADLRAEGNTALFDAVVAGINLIKAAPNERRAIVLLSDGLDNRSSSDRGGALAAVANAGLPIFSISLGADTDTAFLEQVARGSGGRSYRAPTPAEVAGIFDVLGEELRSQYVLTVPLAPAESANRTLLVSTSIDGAVETSTFEFLAPQAATGAANEGGGGVPAFVWLLIPAGAAAILLPLGARFWSRRRGRSRRGTVQGGQAGGAPASPVAGNLAHANGAFAGRLVVVDGPSAGLAVNVGEAPVDIGSGATCSLRIEGENGSVANVHARAWLKRDRLMVHHVARAGSTLLRGTPIEWASLAPEDAIAIGPHTITFRLEARP